MVKKPYTSFYRKGKPFCDHPLNRTLTEALLIAISVYFIVKRLCDVSASSWLERYLTPDAAAVIVTATIGGVAYSAVLKIFNLVFVNFPATSALKIDHEGFAELCLHLNKEIENHIERIGDFCEYESKQLSESHHFKNNIALIISCLAEHIRNSVSGFKVKRRDVFISVYWVESFEAGVAFNGILKYITHFDPRRDGIKSNSIDVNSKQFADYECVKCLRSGKKTWVETDHRKILRTGKRSKTIRNYVGFSIRINDKVVGFLNIELHRRSYFYHDDDLLDYAETDLMGYKYMIEYQFLKMRFFHLIDQYEQQHRTKSNEHDNQGEAGRKQAALYRG